MQQHNTPREELLAQVPARDIAGEVLAGFDLRTPPGLEARDRPLHELHQPVQEDRAAARSDPGQRRNEVRL